ncbi:ABC transporter permease subunit [Neobacillus sp. NRS-1170]|uniref:ABC transporter permease subunit n=1 Tax=Neobacillus sp. NRS-1170 TaxID=3233898 RepID=UPI003D26C1C3
MYKLLEIPIRIFLMVSGILFVFALPSLVGIGDTLTINFQPFWKYVEANFQKITQLGSHSFIRLYEQLNLAESYLYSMTIVFSSLLVVVFVGMAVAILVQMAPKKLGNLFKKVINFFEAVPDLLILFLFQFFVITLYKTTGLKFLQLYGNFGHKPYVIPIITVSFLPTLFLIQFFIKVLEEEELRDYVLYGKAKGLSQFRVLMVHMLRNIFPLYIIQLRTSIWIILSTIYLLEFMLNIPGFTKNFVISIGTGEILMLVICLLLFTVPLLLIEATGYLVSRFYKGKESASL